MKMNVVYATDRNFLKVLVTSITSLVNFNKDVNIYIIQQNLNENDKKQLELFLSSLDISYHVIDMPNLEEELHVDLDIKRYSLSMFSRILVDNLLPDDIDKILYLDCDTMINNDLSELFEIDLSNKIIGAVPDFRNKKYSENLNISPYYYINSGVLLIDLIKYRERECSKKIIKYILQNNGLLEFPDNDAICYTMKENIKYLPLKFNVISACYACDYNNFIKLRKPEINISQADFISAKNKPSIVHFTTCFWINGRPWYKDCNHPLAGLWKKYYDQTYFGSEPLLSYDYSFKKKIMNFILFNFPQSIIARACGLLHAHVKPLYQRRKNKMSIKEEC